MVAKIDNIDVTATLESAKEHLNNDDQLSPGTRAIFETLILIITLLLNRLGLNSSNSSKPPSSDPNRKKKNSINNSGKKPGGQNGHEGKI